MTAIASPRPAPGIGRRTRPPVTNFYPGRTVHNPAAPAHTRERRKPHTFSRRRIFCYTNTNNGCACTPNQSIKCTVTNCAHHCQDQNYCGLNAITVGTHETNPTKVECTDCQSFQMK